MSIETSDRVSAFAARYAKLTPQTLLALTATESSLENAAAEIRSIAASALRQDESKGLRGLVRRIIGKG